MGGEPWIYFVPYYEDINGALRVLREQEFRAGRYRQSTLFRDRGLDSSNIDQDYSNSKKSAEELIAEYGSNEQFWEFIERGQGIYIIIYKNAKPVEICFAGYSFD